MIQRLQIDCKSITVEYSSPGTVEHLKCDQCIWEGNLEETSPVVTGNYVKMCCPHCSSVVAKVSYYQMEPSAKRMAVERSMLRLRGA